MVNTGRKKLQGVKNIIRFNWPFFVLSAILITGLFIIASFVNGWLPVLLNTAGIFVLLMTVCPLAVSAWIYDFSGLYYFRWMGELLIPDGAVIININAGFDETTTIIRARFPGAVLHVYDFYDKRIHTEASIRRARKDYPPNSGTIRVQTNTLPQETGSVSLAFLIFAAHEIRSRKECVVFFRELRRCLTRDGRIILVEHQRDLPNFLAYNIGFLHFHGRRNWLYCFREAGLVVSSETNLNPFIKKFILQSDGTAS